MLPPTSRFWHFVSVYVKGYWRLSKPFKADLPRFKVHQIPFLGSFKVEAMSLHFAATPVAGFCLSTMVNRETNGIQQFIWWHIDRHITRNYMSAFSHCDNFDTIGTGVSIGVYKEVIQDWRAVGVLRWWSAVVRTGWDGELILSLDETAFDNLTDLHCRNSSELYISSLSVSGILLSMLAEAPIMRTTCALHDGILIKSRDLPDRIMKFLLPLACAQLDTAHS